jgi:hypothetical protein
MAMINFLISFSCMKSTIKNLLTNFSYKFVKLILCIGTNNIGIIVVFAVCRSSLG